MESMLRAVLNRQMLANTAMMVLCGSVTKFTWEDGYRTVPVVYALMGILFVIRGWYRIQSEVAIQELGKLAEQPTPNEGDVACLESEVKQSMKRAKQILRFVMNFLSPAALMLIPISGVIDRLFGFKI